MSKPKHEYRIVITCTEHYSVYVFAEDDEQAVDLALNKYYNGDADVEQTYEDTEANVDWCGDDTWTDEEIAAHAKN